MRYSELNGRGRTKVCSAFCAGFMEAHEDLVLLRREAGEIMGEYDPVCVMTRQGWELLHASPNPMTGIGGACISIIEDRFDRWLKKDEQ